MTVPTAAQARRERRLAALERVTELAVELAEATAAYAAAHPEDAQASVAFERVTRVIRRTVALGEKIEAGGFAASPVVTVGRGTLLKKVVEEPRVVDVRRLVRGAIERSAEPGDREYLFHDLDLRLEQEKLNDVFWSEKFQDVVMMLCDEFGVKPDCSKWTDAELGMPGFPPGGWQAARNRKLAMAAKLAAERKKPPD